MQDKISGVDASWNAFLDAPETPLFQVPVQGQEKLSGEVAALFHQLPEGHVLLMRWGVNTLFRGDHHGHDYLFRWKNHDGERAYMAARYDDERRLPGSYFGKEEALGFVCTSLPKEIDGIVDGMLEDIGSMVSWRHASPYGNGFEPALTYWQIDPHTHQKTCLGSVEKYSVPLIDRAVSVARPAMELFAGVKYRDPERLQRTLHGYGLDVNIVDKGALMTPLIYSVYQNAPEITKKLLDAGANPNIAPSKEGVTALMIAANHGNGDICDQLLAHPDIDIGQTCVNGRTAVDYAHDLRLKMTLRLALDRQNAQELLKMPPELWQQHRNQGQQYRRKFMP